MHSFAVRNSDVQRTEELMTEHEVVYSGKNTLPEDADVTQYTIADPVPRTFYDAVYSYSIADHDAWVDDEISPSEDDSEDDDSEDDDSEDDSEEDDEIEETPENREEEKRLLYASYNIRIEEDGTIFNTLRPDGYFYKGMVWYNEQIASNSRTDQTLWEIGETKSLPDGVSPLACSRGFHASTALQKARSYVSGPILALVKLSGPCDVQEDKVAATNCQLIRAVDTDNTYVLGVLKSLVEKGNESGVFSEVNFRYIQETVSRLESGQDQGFTGSQTLDRMYGYMDMSRERNAIHEAYNAYFEVAPAYNPNAPEIKWRRARSQLVNIQLSLGASLENLQYRLKSCEETAKTVVSKLGELNALEKTLAQLMATTVIDDIATTTTTTTTTTRKITR